MREPAPTVAGATGAYRELTVTAVVLGVVLGALMTAAFVYIGLRLGFTMPGSTVAAILGFVALRGVLRRGTIVENNINQTVASAVNNASAGIAFTLPALFLLAQKDGALSFGPWPILLAATAGSFLGVVFIIPLRKQMIELERLRFPTGIAVAKLLRAPGASMRQAALLGIGFGVAAVPHVLSGFEVIPEEYEIGVWLGLPAYAPVAVGISFASLGAGLLAGKGGLPFVLGGMLAYWIIAPVAVAVGWVPGPAELGAAGEAYESHVAWKIEYAEMLRPLGIGVLIGGALAGVIASFPAIRAAIRGLAQSSRLSGGSDELSGRVLAGWLGASLVVLFVASFTSSPDIGLARAAVIAVVGTAWLGLAGLIVAQATGMTDISPISGMSLIGVTLMFFLAGGNVVSAIILGVAVSIGVGQCADMMLDLKAGHLIGSVPRRQQLAQLSVSWLGVPVAVAMIYFLWNNGGFGPDNPALSAPQGSALAAVIDSLRAGAAPLDKYVSGAAIGLALGVYPIGGMGVLVGLAMYLPFYITLTYGVGCFAGMALERVQGAHWMGETLVPVAAGFIIGEALTSVIVVFIRVGLGV